MARGAINGTKSNPQPEALTEWPKPPDSFTKGECVAWSDLGVALLALGTVAVPDLLLVRITARTMARLDATFADQEDAKITAINALSRLAADLLNRLGLSPQARGTVATLPKKKKGDALSEFE